MIAANGIRVENVYYMLAYAFRALSEGEFADVAAERFEDAEDLFGAILSLGMAGLLKRGLFHNYVEVCDDMSGLRGKIDLVRTVRHVAARRNLLGCTYDEFSANNLFNRILKTTAAILLRSGRLSKSLPALKRVLVCFGGMDEIPLQAICWGELRYQRNNSHYVMLMNVCRFVLDGMLMGDNDGGGAHRIRKIRYDDEKMSRLYEAFIREYYARHFNLCSRAAQIDWALGEDDDGSQLPRMQSDIVLSNGEKKLIIDAKFYSRSMQQYMSKYTVHSHNLYQILAYVSNEQAWDSGRSVGGMLLYAKTDESHQPNVNVTIAGRPLSVRTLDLACPFAEISRSLDEIAENFFGKLEKY